MNGPRKGLPWDSRRRPASTEKIRAKKKRSQQRKPRRANCPVVFVTATTLQTNQWEAVRFPSTMPSTRGAAADTRHERAVFGFANPVIASGRRKTNPTTCIEVHFHLHLRGGANHPVPPAHLGGHEPTNDCEKLHDERRHFGCDERRFGCMETEGRSTIKDQT